MDRTVDLKHVLGNHSQILLSLTNPIDHDTQYPLSLTDCSCSLLAGLTTENSDRVRHSGLLTADGISQVHYDGAVLLKSELWNPWVELLAEGMEYAQKHSAHLHCNS